MTSRAARRARNVNSANRHQVPIGPDYRDPDDEMVLEVAVNGGADAIITFNSSDFAPAATRFGIARLSPSEALTAASASTFRHEETLK